MMRICALCILLSAATVYAQPVPPPAPVPAPVPPPVPSPSPPEKGTSNESLHEGGDARPWAAGVTPENQKKALEMFREGNQAHNDGLFAKAVEIYRAALKFWDHPAIHYNMALSLTNLEKPIEVEAELQASIKFGAGPLEKGKFEHAKQSLLLIEQQLATIEVSCQKEGARVSIDNKEVFVVAAGKPNVYKARVRIGKHTFVAEKPGYATGLDAPFIGPGETFRIELKLYTAEELTRYSRRWKAKWMPYAVMGGGVVAGAVGFALARSAQSSYDDFDTAVRKCNEQLGPNGGCMTNDANLDLRDSGDSKKTAAYIGYGIAGAAIVTGGVLLYLNRSQAYQISSDDYRREQLEKERAGAKQITVTPVVSPDMAGAMVFGRF
ncbi:MAG: hypothetical protein H0T65_10350 [Deltaproteobacteria bacterium]|nr:hypothetical protein [Deltaproteobacteria bacterium]